MRSWWIDRARSPARCGLCVGGWDPSTVQVAAPPSAVGLGPELSLKLHQASDPGASARMYGSTLAAASWTLARSTPSSCAHRSSGAAIGRPRPGSCQVPTDPGYRTQFENQSSILRTATGATLSCMDGLPSFHEAARSRALQPSPTPACAPNRPCDQAG